MSRPQTRSVLYLEEVGDGRGVEQLVGDLLEGGAGGGVHPLDGYRGGGALVDGLEGVLDLGEGERLGDNREVLPGRAAPPG